MSQFIQMFKNINPGSPVSPKREGRFRKFRRNGNKSSNYLEVKTNLSKKRSVSTSALTHISEDEMFVDNRRRNSVVEMTTTSTTVQKSSDEHIEESDVKNRISVKELIEKMITHLQVLERKNDILSKHIQTLNEEKTSLESDLSSTKVELNLYKNRLNQIERMAEEWHCSLCLDNKLKIINSKRLIVSTLCGHLFCSLCAKSLMIDSRPSKHCPVCHKPLKDGNNIHPIFI